MQSHDAVLFDLDGVIVDSRSAFAESINAALAANGFAERPGGELHRYLGPPLHATFRELTADAASVQACVDAYRAHYRVIAAAATRVVAGMPQLLAAAAERMPLVVATSKPSELAVPLLEALGLRRYFRAVAGPELSAENEPKSETMRRALAELDPGSRPVMVGDRSYDVLAAHDHGLAAIGVLWGIGSEHELRSAGAELLAQTPQVLSSLLLGRRA